MKNPFEKDNYKIVILAGAVLSLAAAGAAYLFLRDKGENTRKGLQKKIKSIAKNAAVDAISKKTKLNKKAVKAATDHIVKTD
jgi:hypothetical protein